MPSENGAGASIPPETRLWTIFTILPCPEKFLNFHLPKFLTTLFSHRPQISNFPLFQYISPLFRENYYFPPTLPNFRPPVFDKFTCFLHTLRVFRFPPTLTMMHLCITQCTYWTPVRHAILDQFSPSPVTLCHTSRDP